VKQLIIKYAILAALLLTTVWWAKTGALDSRPAFFLALAAYIGADIYSLKKPSDSINHDRTIFKNFLSAFPSNGSIRFIKNNNFAGFSFNMEALNDIDRFYYEWNDAEHEFLDKKLEIIKKNLYKEVSLLENLIAVNTFPTHNRGWSTVPPEWEEEDPERFNTVVALIHNSASKVVMLHQELIRACKKKLGDVQDIET